MVRLRRVELSHLFTSPDLCHSLSLNKWVCLKMGYTPNYSHLVGIMISKTIGFLGVHNIFRQTQMGPQLPTPCPMAMRLFRFWIDVSQHRIIWGRIIGLEDFFVDRHYEYPAWWTNILPWEITILYGKIHYKWPFSIVSSPEGKWNISIFNMNGGLIIWDTEENPSFLEKNRILAAGKNN